VFIAEFLKSIQFVTGLLSLLAFLAVVFLAVYYRSVKDKRGLEYLFKLFQTHTDKDTFYTLSKLAIERTFWFFLIFMVLAFIGYLVPSLYPPTNPNVLGSKYQDLFTRAVSLSQEQGNVGEAITSFKKILRQYPAHAASHAGLGKAYYNLGKYQDAIDSYRSAATHDPSNLHYKLSEALVAAKLGNDDTAIDKYNDILKKGPDPRIEEKVRYSLGNAYRRQGVKRGNEENLRSALTEYQTVKAMSGEFKASAAFNLACTYALLVNAQDDNMNLEMVISNLRETLAAEKDRRQDLILGTQKVECSENLSRLREFPRYRQFLDELLGSH